MQKSELAHSEIYDRCVPAILFYRLQGSGKRENFRVQHGCGVPLGYMSTVTSFIEFPRRSRRCEECNPLFDRATHNLSRDRSRGGWTWARFAAVTVILCAFTDRCHNILFFRLSAIKIPLFILLFVWLVLRAINAFVIWGSKQTWLMQDHPHMWVPRNIAKTEKVNF